LWAAHKQDRDIDVDEPEVQPTSVADESRRLRASWLDGGSRTPPESPRQRGRIGWLAVGIAVVALMLPAVWAAVETHDVDPNDSGWAEFAFLLSPFWAIAAAVVIGVVLIVVAAMRLIGLRTTSAAIAMGIGVVAGPVIYLAVLIASASALDSAQSSVLLAVITWVFPVVCGIGATLVPAFLFGRRTTD
jgi:hypothetical protein